MQIGIVGFGFVGSAIAWAHKHQTVIINDPKLKDSVPLEKFTGCDAVFICIPSPPTEDGHCDTSILENVLENLEVENTVPIISKVTAPPETYERLQKLYPNLVHSPEFLTAKNNIKDYINAEYFVVGGHSNFVEPAIDVILSGVDISRHKVLITDIKTAAFYKYMMNCYLATKVTFMNEFYSLAEADNIDWDAVKRLTFYDDRLGPSHMDVPGHDGQFGWGGHCFPKDVSAIIEYALDKNIDFELMDRIESINAKHRRKHV